ncbi:hypothetical protein ACU4GH_37445 [Bradyrhizobium betae]
MKLAGNRQFSTSERTFARERVPIRKQVVLLDAQYGSQVLSIQQVNFRRHDQSSFGVMLSNTFQKGYLLRVGRVHIINQYDEPPVFMKWR